MRLPKPKLVLPLLALLAMAAPSLQAADLKFGLEWGPGIPTGDLKDIVDNHAGLDVGFYMLADLGGGHALRPRVTV